MGAGEAETLGETLALSDEDPEENPETGGDVDADADGEILLGASGPPNWVTSHQRGSAGIKSTILSLLTFRVSVV